MKQVSTPREMRFSAEFERRLERLQRAIENYLYNEGDGDILPALYSCASYLWCRSPYVTELKKNGR